MKMSKIDSFKNKYIRGRVQVEQFGDKVRKPRLGWLGQVQRKNSGYTG